MQACMHALMHARTHAYMHACMHGGWIDGWLYVCVCMCVSTCRALIYNSALLQFHSISWKDDLWLYIPVHVPTDIQIHVRHGTARHGTAPRGVFTKVYIHEFLDKSIYRGLYTNLYIGAFITKCIWEFLYNAMEALRNQQRHQKACNNMLDNIL